eukprot:SM000105S13914  [mRNA]  locus=s105:356138:362673:- [translate_table: standard]
MAFWRPGAERPPSLELDRDGESVQAAIAPYNRYTSLSLAAQRQQLPIARHRAAILYLVESHATTVVVGQTGCGKTTQIPQLIKLHFLQYLADAGWASGGRLVGCTQPRRVAVQTVSARVADEMGVPLGREVGYAIRFENVTSSATKVKYLTDGVLLREMMEDPLLSRYSVLMVDEVHERSVASDVLLGLLKKIQRRRPDFRLIIASATLAAKEMADFFDTSKERARISNVADTPSRKPAILSVEGRMHQVQVQYLQEPCSDYLETEVETTLSVHKQEGPGDVLVFLTGQEEVDTTVQLLTERGQGLVPLPLYAGLPRADQDIVFAPAPRGKRKVVCATNIAETSVTLEVSPNFLLCLHSGAVLQYISLRCKANKGVVYVVDCGFFKQRFYNPASDVDALMIAPISRASALQGAGRAGRTRPGKCFRSLVHRVNIQRGIGIPSTSRDPTFQSGTNRSAVVLCGSVIKTICCHVQLKSLGVDNIMSFDWLASPSSEAMVRALEVLFALGVLDSSAKLTKPLGMQLAEMPLEPMLSKSLVVSGELGCSEELLTIAATICVQSVWQSSRGRQKELDEVKGRFAVAEGDHVTFLNVYKGFQQSGKSSKWCQSNLINYKAMVRICEVRVQLKKLLTQLTVPLKSCGRDTELVSKAVVGGFFSNAAQLQRRSNAEDPSSVLFRLTPKWVVYNSVMVTEQEHMREVTAINPAWLTELAPHFYKLHDVQRAV